MKIIKFSPAFGHNIEQFIRAMNTMDNISLHIMYFGKNNLECIYKNVAFTKILSYKGLLEIYKIISGKYDLVWVQGGNLPIIPVALLKILHKPIKKKTIWIYNVWGEKIILTMEKKSITSFFYKKALALYDVIHLNWYTLKPRLQKFVPEDKILVFLWGLPECYFNKISSPPNNITKYKIHQDKSYKFFFPKSITSYSGHLLIAQAVKYVLNTHAISNFKIYILEGNGKEEDAYMDFIKYININKLNQYFVFLKFEEYLTPQEMNYLWKHFNCGLQIVYRDQLSNTLIEPLASGLPIIASNLQQYSDFSNYFNLKLELTENTLEALSKALVQKTTENHDGLSILKIRADAIKKKYIFENNLNIIIEHYQNIVNN